ncbi:MAG: urea ABC transporter ATP-binding protein UrtD [Proteobacteria bacterium]|nr:urea ABC transporter ATP-binding protein UrtD [Pseudomonadota bacterium]
MPQSQTDKTDVQKSLVIDALEVDYSGFRAVDGFNLQVDDGELRVILGANGAGKTTLLDLISGTTKSTSGSVYLNGVDITNWEEHKIARAGVGRKFQIPSVFKELTVLQNLLVAEGQEYSVFSNLLKNATKGYSDKIAEIIKLIELEHRINEPASNLSHGETQWLEIGMLLVQDPHIILLDEPTAGMTTQETKKTADIINRLKGQRTLIVVEHDMGFVRAIAETITVMHLGQWLAEGCVSEIEKDPKVMEAYLGSGGIGHV